MEIMFMDRRLNRLLPVCCLLTLASMQCGWCDVIRVPDEVPTIGAALAQANAGDVVEVTAGEYHERLTITTGSLTLRGVASVTSATLMRPVIDGDVGGSVITIEGANDLKISGFEIRNGAAERGAGISISHSCVYLTSCSINENVATGITGIDFINRPATEGLGGGIYLYDSVTTISECSVTSNTAQGASAQHLYPADGKGGGIYSSGSNVVVVDSELHNNTAAGRGSGNPYGLVYISHGWGGGCYFTSSTVRLVKSSVSSNIAGGHAPGYTGSGVAYRGDAYGGGICAVQSHLFGDQIELRANESQGVPTGVTLNGHAAIWEGMHGNGLGGGIYVGQGDTTVTRSSIIDNKSLGYVQPPIVTGNATYVIPTYNQGKGHGGAIYVIDATMYLANSTLSGNQANTDSGAIFSKDSSVRSVNNTLAGNQAPAVGGVHGEGSGGVSAQSTLFDGNGDELDGAVVSAGHNMWTGVQTFPLDSTDLIVSAAGTGPLTEVAEGVWVYPLTLNSPAVDAAANSAAPSDDQRGVARPQGLAADIGAYEYVGPVKSLRLIAPQLSKTYGVQEAVEVRWIADLATAGSAIRAELWQGSSHVADLGYDWNPTGVGDHVFTIPAVPAGRGYKFLIRSTWDPGMVDASNAPFSIGTMARLGLDRWEQYR